MKYFYIAFFSKYGFIINFLLIDSQSQKFIMAKSDYKTQASPCIWRIDGRNLLQKYELVKQSEGTSYHNISTVRYLTW